METIVFLDRDSVQAEFRAPAFAHRWVAYGATRPDEVVPRLAEATVVITNKVVLPAPVIAQAPHLRFVAVAATGIDILDREALRERGIVASHVRGYARESVPEHVLMLMLALSRQLPSYQAAMAQGAWERSAQFCWFGPPIRDLAGLTLGLVGWGDLAARVAALGGAFGMRVLVAERRGASLREGRVPFEQVLMESDVLSLHCPLTPETRHLIGAAELAAMKPGALLINTARGGLIDAEALLAALRSGQLGGAGIDVLPEEPPVHGHPLLEAQLPNLIVTPHVAWASRTAMQALADQVIDNLEAFVRGEPRHVVT